MGLAEEKSSNSWLRYSPVGLERKLECADPRGSWIVGLPVLAGRFSCQDVVAVEAEAADNLLLSPEPGGARAVRSLALELPTRSRTMSVVDEAILEAKDAGCFPFPRDKCA